MCFEACRCCLDNRMESVFTQLLLESQHPAAHQDNDITGLGLSKSTSYAEMCVVEVFLLNRVSMISDVTFAVAVDYCKHWSLNQMTCLQSEGCTIFFSF